MTNEYQTSAMQEYGKNIINVEGGKTQMAYEEINPTEWKPEKDEDFIEGIYVLEKKDVGVNKSKLYSIETSEGVKNVWGSAILDSRMAHAKIGDKVKITYKGLGEATGGKNAPKIFKVEVDKKLHPEV